MSKEEFRVNVIGPGEPGLNYQFKRDPVAFLSLYWDINSSQSQYGEGYGINAKGIANLDLVYFSPQSVGIAKARGKQKPIKAYYLAAEAAKAKALVLGDDCDYFFTDTITGCQFMAYGKSRRNVRTVHTNAKVTRKSDGGFRELTTREMKLSYKVEADAVRALDLPFKLVFGPPNYRAGLNQGETLENVVVTVIGWRRDDGWHFYTRRRLNDPNNQRVLDDKAYEL